MSGPLLGLPAAVDEVYKVLNSGTPLASMFDWAGGRFPFAGATNVTISANTTWDNTSHPQGFAKVKKLTINASRTLTIRKSPFYIFAEEIVGGGANAIIDASGPNGAASGSFTCEQPWGGTATSGSGRAQGGCGGGLLLIVCNKFSGTAITIKANGGNGYTNSGDTSASTVILGGQGAFSYTIISGPSSPVEVWDGTESPSSSLRGHLHSLGLLLAPGGGQRGGAGGGSGASNNGGSGIGGGGGIIFSGSSGVGDNGRAAKRLMPHQLIVLAEYGCRGGGGGSSVTGGVFNGVPLYGASGGGGGALLVYANDIASVVPTLQANGGTGAGSGGSGGAGITIYVNLAV